MFGDNYKAVSQELLELGMKKISPNYHKYNVFCVTRKYEDNNINKVMHGLFIPIKLKGYSKYVL